MSNHLNIPKNEYPLQPAGSPRRRFLQHCRQELREARSPNRVIRVPLKKPLRRKHGSLRRVVAGFSRSEIDLDCILDQVPQLVSLTARPLTFPNTRETGFSFMEGRVLASDLETVLNRGGPLFSSRDNVLREQIQLGVSMEQFGKEVFEPRNCLACRDELKVFSDELRWRDHLEGVKHAKNVQKKMGFSVPKKADNLEHFAEKMTYYKVIRIPHDLKEAYEKSIRE
eukprot:707537_1